MAIPFSKTTRQLQADRFGVRIVILLVLVLLMGIWGLWFATAEISLWSHSTGASLRTSNSIEATFPAEDYFLLQVGQPARLLLNENSGQDPIYISANVTAIEPQSDGLAVRLAIAKGDRPVAVDLQPGLSGRIEIETTQRTPAQLLMQYLRLRSAQVSQ